MTIVESPPELVRQTILSRFQGVYDLAGSEIVTSDEQTRADQICKQTYLDCEQLLQREGRELLSPHDQYVSIVLKEPVERRAMMSRTLRLERRLIDQAGQSGHIIGVYIPAENYPVAVTLYSMGYPDSQQIRVSVDEISHGRGALHLNGAYGEMRRTPTMRHSDVTERTLRRANLYDANHFKELTDYVGQHLPQLQRFT